MAATSNIAKKIFASAMETIAPDKLARNSLHRRGDVLVVNDKEYRLKENVYVVGYGKAVLGRFTFSNFTFTCVNNFFIYEEINMVCNSIVTFLLPCIFYPW